MEFKCSLCDYSSDTRKNVIRHINKKIKCGDGEANIMLIKIDISCEFCKKSITTKPNLIKHLKVCKVKKQNLEKENEILKEKTKN
jgi:hypothetical protein